MRLGRVKQMVHHVVAMPQLEMLWPVGTRVDPPTWTLPEGFDLRTYRSRDVDAWSRLMERAGFDGCDERLLRAALLRTIPDGCFMVVRGGEIVATAMAHHNPSRLHPFGGQLSWVASDPVHRGKGLGLAVSAAVTARLLHGGYRRIYLETDDWRLPAIKTYLRLGYVPFLYRPDMRERWRLACSQAGWPFEPEKWIIPDANEPR